MHTKKIVTYPFVLPDNQMDRIQGRTGSTHHCLVFVHLNTSTPIFIGTAAKIIRKKRILGRTKSANHLESYLLKRPTLLIEQFFYNTWRLMEGLRMNSVPSGVRIHSRSGPTSWDMLIARALAISPLGEILY